MNRNATTFEQWRWTAFEWRTELAWPAKLGLALLMAATTGLAAHIRFPLPHTPVPVTGQVFAVLLSGILLGRAWGGLSQVLYVGLGAAGVPWFATWPLGPTAGFLAGFIVAATAIGWASDRFVWARHLVPQLLLMLGGVALIYGFGAAGFAAVMHTGLSATLSMAVLPFVGFDIVKAVAAAGVAAALLPKNRPGRDGAT
jgi:biotin transport system substrate-specific component